MDQGVFPVDTKENNGCYNTVLNVVILIDNTDMRLEGYHSESIVKVVTPNIVDLGHMRY